MKKDDNIGKEKYKEYFEDQELKTDTIKELDKYGRKNGLNRILITKKFHLKKNHLM